MRCLFLNWEACFYFSDLLKCNEYSISGKEVHLCESYSSCFCLCIISRFLVQWYLFINLIWDMCRRHPHQQNIPQYLRDFQNRVGQNWLLKDTRLMSFVFLLYICICAWHISVFYSYFSYTSNEVIIIAVKQNFFHEFHQCC